MTDTTQIQLSEKPSFVFSPTPQPVQPSPEVAATDNSVSSALVPIMADPVQREQLVFSEHMAPADKAKARQAAMQLYQVGLQNTNAIVTFGDKSLQPLNDLVKYQLTQVRPISVPGLRQEMETFQRQMAAIKGNYDLDNPKVKADYERYLNGAKSWLHRVKDFAAMFKADVMSIEKQIEQIEKALAGAQVETLKNVVIYDQIFQKNELGIQALMFDLAVMEYYIDYVVQLKPPTQKADGSTMTAHDIDMWKQNQAQQVMIMRTKLANTKGRLAIAWTTSPQMKMSQMTDIGLQAQLHNLENQAVPLARQMLLQMRTAMADLENARIAGTVKTLVNNMAQQNAALHAQTVTTVMAMACNPIYLPETINYITAMLDKAADGVVNGYQAGEAVHKQVDQAMVEQQQHLTNSTDKISGEVLQKLVTKAVQPLPAALTTVQSVALPAQ
jgi:uncharacterized protein YaaN involved in tellurite resistance